MKYKLTLAYDGTAYSGWQVQANSRSIQQIVQKTIETILQKPTSLTGAGRTDAGVHALGQTAHIETENPLDLSRFSHSANSLLPPDIRLIALEPVDDSFHARYSATGKIYRYHLCLRSFPSPFKRLYETHVPEKLDLSLIEKALPYFIGTHDFTSFASEAHRGSAAKDPVKTIRSLELFKEEEGIYFEFRADGFLYKMVRNIVGTLLDIGTKKLPLEELPLIFAAKDRKKAGQCAPPTGLFLVKVEYP